MKKYVIYTGDPEFDALYVDGELALLGKDPEVKHYLMKELGVVERPTDAFFLGREARAAHVEGYLSVVEAYERSDGTRTPEELRRQASLLLEQARAMEESRGA